MEENKEIKKVEGTDTGVDNTDIDAILGIFPKNHTTDDHIGHDHHQEKVEYVDDPVKWQQQVGRTIKKPEGKINPITTKSIKHAKHVASIIVFWICIAAAICITASIMLGSWVLLKPTGLLFTVIMVILAMGITLLFTQLYACVKEAIDTSC